MFCFYIFFNPNSLFTTCSRLHQPHKPPDGNWISTKHSPRAFTPDKLNVLMTVFECYKFSSCHRRPTHLIIYCPSGTIPEYPLPTYRQQSAKPKCPYITDPYKPFRRNLSSASITFVPNILNGNAIILRQSLHRTHQNVPNTDSNQQIRHYSIDASQYYTKY